MRASISPLSNETAYAIAAVSLFAFGHYGSAVVCLALALRASWLDRQSRLAAERAHLPSDELPTSSSRALPPIAEQTSTAPGSVEDPWEHDAKR